MSTRLNKGGQSFATINAKAATLNFVSPKSTHVSLPILSSAQSNMLIFLMFLFVVEDLYLSVKCVGICWAYAAEVQSLI